MSSQQVLRNSIWSRRISECFVSLLFFSCWGGLGVGAWSGLDLPSTISKPPGGSIWFEKRRTFWGWDLIPHPMYPMYSLEHLALMSSSSSTMDGVSTASTDRATSVLHTTNIRRALPSIKIFHSKYAKFKPQSSFSIRSPTLFLLLLSCEQQPKKLPQVPKFRRVHERILRTKEAVQWWCCGKN